MRLQITFKYFKVYYAGLAYSSGIVQFMLTNTKM
jgi:hypothetical protein